MAEASATDHLPLATGAVNSVRQSTLSCLSLQVVMEDPVMCSDGHTYSRAAITAWLDANGAVSPLTSQPLARSELTPKHALRNTIEAVLQRQARDNCEPSVDAAHGARTR